MTAPCEGFDRDHFLTITTTSGDVRYVDLMTTGDRVEYVLPHFDWLVFWRDHGQDTWQLIEHRSPRGHRVQVHPDQKAGPELADLLDTAVRVERNRRGNRQEGGCQ